ncbi:helix-turn-helix domain-containing protein [Peterkaempfera griseoplana]|uniref:hypothetical protein n=1 Tax=Peterkaempfera griseoplana TaxID=66896 RepID=UPI0006E1AF94|nr:hypothetical protein [Peterkaempfera griseoplana]
MSYAGRIKRGPMAADVIGRNFTMLHNAALRDRRLSRRARGLLGEISTHRDGFGISIPSLVAAGPEGRDAIRSALAELETYGYLHRRQERDPETGRLGDAVYEITDMPDELPAMATAPWEDGDVSCPEVRDARRSGPSSDFPSSAHPSSVNPPHKKISSKNTSGKKTLSPHTPDQPAQLPTATSGTEREISTPQERPTAAQRAVRASGAVPPDQETAFIAWVHQQHHPRSPAWWRKAANDLGELADTWRRTTQPPAATSGLPPWCGDCGDGSTAARTNPAFRFIRLPNDDKAPCPACHPGVADTAA